MSIESYLTDAYNYIISNFKKLCVGGLISAIVGAMCGALVGFIQLFTEKTNYDPLHFIMSFMIYFGILFIISLIVSIFISGYYVRVMKTTVEGLKEAPDWNKIDDLFVKGIFYIIGLISLALIFLIIPMGLYVFACFLLPINKTAGLVFILLATLLLIFLLIALWFYSKLAEVNYSVKGFLGFFEFREIFEMISLKYILLVIILLIIGIVISLIVVVPLDVIGAFLSVLAYTNKNIAALYITIKILSYALSTFVDFYLAIFSIRAVALYYKDRRG